MRGTFSKGVLREGGQGRRWVKPQRSKSEPLGVSEETKQEREARERRLRWHWVEAEVWSDPMLAALENGVKGGKWFSLIDKVYAKRTLRQAWKRVKAKRGAGGVDRISVGRFAQQSEKYLDELHEDLKAERYEVQAVRRVYIAKGGGKQRALGIPTVKDRVVQMALKMALEPIFEQEFIDVSYGFRPGRSAKDALREVDALLKGGYVWVIDADLERYFDTIAHDRLLQHIEAHISDGKVLALIRAYLDQEVMEGLERWIPTRGTPQGAVLSPLLANIYLHPMDERLSRRYNLVRYADDFVILCGDEREAGEALEEVRRFVASNELELHPDKTHVGDCTQKGQGFEFLGYRFEAGRRHVRRKSRQAMRARIRQKTRRTRGDSLERIIVELNPMLRGWFNYFQHASRFDLQAMDGFVRRRLRALLRKQQKRPGRGMTAADHHRWPNTFFARQGLFTCDGAFVLARQSRCGNV